MSSRKFSVVRASHMRATITDACGRPKYGERVTAVTDGFVSVADTAQWTDGTAIVQENANGRRCVNRPAIPQFNGRQLVLTFCNVDPEFYAALTGTDLIYDPVSGDTIGVEDASTIDLSKVRLALELWSENGTVDAACDPDDPDGYAGVMTVYPFLQGGRVGDVTFANAAVNFTVNAAQTLDGSQWGAGPYLVYRDAAGELMGLPEPARNVTHRQQFATTVAPPSLSGYQGLRPLDDPTKPAATGATAGAPGQWTPAGNRRPADMAELEAGTYAASPSTAWAAGQYVSLLDGTRVTWDGTDWQDLDEV